MSNCEADAGSRKKRCMLVVGSERPRTLDWADAAGLTTVKPVFCFFLICMRLELTFARMEKGRAVAGAAAAEPEVSLPSQSLSSLSSSSKPARGGVRTVVWILDALRFFGTI
jgi:hypothetical protein